MPEHDYGVLGVQYKLSLTCEGQPMSHQGLRVQAVCCGVQGQQGTGQLGRQWSETPAAERGHTYRSPRERRGGKEENEKLA